jgi:hypothetical protein
MLAGHSRPFFAGYSRRSRGYAEPPSRHSVHRRGKRRLLPRKRFTCANSANLRAVLLAPSWEHMKAPSPNTLGNNAGAALKSERSVSSTMSSVTTHIYSCSINTSSRTHKMGRRRILYSKLPMKPWLLLFTLSAITITAQAAPARKVARPKWEYAVLQLGTGRQSGNQFEQGAFLYLPDKKIFLAARQSTSAEYKAYIFNRLASQGWELFNLPAYIEDYHYIFKRSK